MPAGASSTATTRAGARCATRHKFDRLLAFGQRPAAHPRRASTRTFARPACRARRCSRRSCGCSRRRSSASATTSTRATTTSFGLTTLRDRHVEVDGAHVALRVPRQERQRAQVDVDDRAPRAGSSALPGPARPGAVPVPRRRRRAPQTSTRRDVNAYLREITGERVHRQGLPHLGRHRAGRARAAANSRASTRRRRPSATSRAPSSGWPNDWATPPRCAGSATSIRRCWIPIWMAPCSSP